MLKSDLIFWNRAYSRERWGEKKRKKRQIVPLAHFIHQVTA